MKRKALIVSITTIIFALFSISYTFAATTMDNVANGARNMVGSAENVVENVGSAVGGAVKSGVDAIGNGAKDIGRGTENVAHDVTDNNDNKGYTATRTSADTGMTADSINRTSTWVIMGITAVGIVVLLWSYFRQQSTNNAYIDSDDDE